MHSSSACAMELLVFCSGTSFNIIVLSKVGHVCQAEDLSLSPGVLGDREKAAVPLQTPRRQVFMLKCGETRFLDEYCMLQAEL